MGYKEMYESWLANPYFDEATKAELKGIAGNEKEIEDRFYTELEFGTAGLRGVIGAGTNRMNTYTVRKATQGLANYIKKVGGENRGVAIAYDSRICSDVFAKGAAGVLAANGTGRALLGRMRETASAPVLTKPAAVRRMDEHAQALFALEARAADLYALAYPDLSAAGGGSIWKEGPVMC